MLNQIKQSLSERKKFLSSSVHSVCLQRPHFHFLPFKLSSSLISTHELNLPAQEQTNLLNEIDNEIEPSCHFPTFLSRPYRAFPKLLLPSGFPLEAVLKLVAEIDETLQVEKLSIRFSSTTTFFSFGSNAFNSIALARRENIKIGKSLLKIALNADAVVVKYF